MSPCLFFSNREELRGISRGKDAKDVDWQKIAGPSESDEEEEEEIEKPAPIKIDVAEVLKRARKPAGKKSITTKRVNKKGRWIASRIKP